MADKNIKKVIIDSTDLPSLYVPDNRENKYLPVAEAVTVNVNIDNVSTNIILYVFAQEHSFVVGDTVEILGDEQSEYSFSNAKIVYIPQDPLTQEYDYKRFGVVTNISEINQAAPASLNLRVAKKIENYIIRYRVVSEDRNRISQWSPLYYIPISKTQSVFTKPISVRVLSDFIIAEWEFDEDRNSFYDVYIAWGATNAEIGNEQYFSTISGSSISIPIGAPNRYGETLNKVKVYIQKTTFPRRRIFSLTVGESEEITLT